MKILCFVLFSILINTAKPAEILIAKKEIPILSYHNIFEKDEKSGPYFISTEVLESQLRKLKESGYQSVLPEDIYSYYVVGKALPEKCVMFSFDDNRLDHYTLAAPLLEKYGYKGAFFIMTVTIGKKNYMKASNIKDLARRGHCIGHHTYDHQNLKKLPEKEWKKQIEDPKKKLEEIIGMNVCYLAYPFGLCNEYAAAELQKRGIYASFQLSGKRSDNVPHQFIRRLLVPGNWSAERLSKEMASTFK